MFHCNRVFIPDKDNIQRILGGVITRTLAQCLEEITPVLASIEHPFFFS